MSNPHTQKATIKLDYPVQLADRLLTEVIMRRPNVGDLLDHPVRRDSSLADEVRMICSLTGLVEEDMRLIDASDYDKLQDQLALFRGLSREELDKIKSAALGQVDGLGLA